MIKRYRKLPMEIEALQYTVDNLGDIVNFVGQDNISFDSTIYRNCTITGIFIKTLEGNMLISEGDFVIKGIRGEFYPCKPDIFKSTYEEVQ